MAAVELIAEYQGKVMFIVGGPVNWSGREKFYCTLRCIDSYAADCGTKLLAFRGPNLWADPNQFFTDGALVNLGSDFGLMPSLFEPRQVF